MYRTLAEEGRRQGEPAILGPSYGREEQSNRWWCDRRRN